jgi:hypothetical protein
MSGKYDWNLLFSCGHKYFLDKNSKKYAVADGSGYFPNETDDGVLWLNTEKPLRLDLYNGSVFISVPLKDRDNKDCSTGASVHEAIRLVEFIKFDVEVANKNKQHFSDLSKLLSVGGYSEKI